MRARAYRPSPITISELCRHDADTARRNPEFAPKPVEYVPFDPLSLSTLQQAALLQMHESHVKRAVIARLLEDAQDRPVMEDYAALRDLDLCERNEGKRYHDLTGQGRVAAAQLEKLLCQKFCIHVKLGGNDNCRGLTTFRCSCGQWTGTVERNIYSGSAGDRAFAKHIREANAGKEAMDIIRTALKPMPTAESA